MSSARDWFDLCLWFLDLTHTKNFWRSVHILLPLHMIESVLFKETLTHLIWDVQILTIMRTYILLNNWQDRSIFHGTRAYTWVWRKLIHAIVAMHRFVSWYTYTLCVDKRDNTVLWIAHHFVRSSRSFHSLCHPLFLALKQRCNSFPCNLIDVNKQNPPPRKETSRKREKR